MKDNTLETQNNNKKKKQLNFGVFIGLAVLLYLIVSFCMYFFGSSNGTYEVVKGQVASNFESQYTALIIRNENVVTSDDDGYINFFVGDTSQIFVGQDTYVIDHNGTISKKLEELSKSQAILNENDLTHIRTTFYDFDTSFSNNDYYETYNLINRIDSQILDLINNNVFSNIISELTDGSYHIGSSEVSGVMLHYIDGFENFTKESVEAQSFRKANYTKHIIKSNDMVKKGDPIYKVVTSDEWYLIIQISNPEDFQDIDRLNIEFVKDNVSTTCKFELMTKAGNTYGVLTLDKYSIRYLSDRYIAIRIQDKTESGLKIPKSSVITRQCYTIPKGFMTQGGNSSDYGFMVEKKDAKGDNSIQFTPSEIIRTNDEFCYVPTDYFEPGDVLYNITDNTTFTINEKENYYGVYIVNNGVNSFRNVDIIGENNNYYIVSANTQNGLKVYDQVIRQPKKE
ncbi:MAG: hypothetical protein IKH67_05580 [Lachnospiraceae bacterium]|nr:hypothetical protein [Lachnospiraceae bacterium]MBR6350551.1 hypothetical protein [Lachnospiraceae bacterium]